MKAFRIKWESGEEEIVVAENIFQASGFYLNFADCGVETMKNADIIEIDFESEPVITYMDFVPKKLTANNVNDFKNPEYICGSMY